MKELSVRYVSVMEDQLSDDEMKDEMIYDMCKYLVKTRDSVWKNCPDCMKGIITKYEDLLSTFLSAEYTAERNQGGLTFVTVNFLKIIWLREDVLRKFFYNNEHNYVSNCYKSVICELCHFKIVKYLL